MATAALCGMGGTVTGTNGATEITNWSVEQTLDLKEATSMASAGWKERVGCLKGGSGSFTCVGTKPSVGASTGTFKTASAGGYSIAGSIIVTKVTVNTDVQDLIKYDCSFNFTGTITAS